MESFKYTNPLSVFSDFVRWHSPRDINNGQLSDRMCGNTIWLQLWNSCNAVDVDTHRLDLRVRGDNVLRELSGWSVDRVWSELVGTVIVVVLEQYSVVQNQSILDRIHSAINCKRETVELDVEMLNSIQLIHLLVEAQLQLENELSCLTMKDRDVIICKCMDGIVEAYECGKLETEWIELNVIDSVELNGFVDMFTCGLEPSQIYSYRESDDVYTVVHVDYTNGNTMIVETMNRNITFINEM